VNTPDGATLIALARNAISAAFGLPARAVGTCPLLEERRGAFVTLTRDGELRGCIGRVQADLRVREVIPEMARAAAFDDPRFTPLTRDEYARIALEVSLLGVPWRVASPDEVRVGTHGVIVSMHGRRGLLLPQVAVEWNWSRDQLLSYACRKAGLPADAWHGPGVRLEVFTSDVYGEETG